MAHFSFLACLMAFSFSVKGSDVSIGHEGVCRHDICAREMHKNTNKKGISLHDMRRKQKTLIDRARIKLVDTITRHGEILLAEITGNVANVIEFIKDSGRAAVIFCQGRYKSRIKKLAAERPEECVIVAENQDGSLCVHIPVAWIKINPTQRFTGG